MDVNVLSCCVVVVAKLKICRVPSSARNYGLGPTIGSTSSSEVQQETFVIFLKKQHIVPHKLPSKIPCEELQQLKSPTDHPVQQGASAETLTSCVYSVSQAVV